MDKPAACADVAAAAENIVQSADASYMVEYTENGVYLSVAYEKADGTPLIPGFVAFDLNRRNISGLNLPDVLVRLKRKQAMIQLAAPQDEKPADSGVAAELSPDEITADMMLFAPVAGGNKKSPEDILESLRQTWRIAYGLDEEAVLRAVNEERYNTAVCVARGRRPVRGKDGSMTLLFKTEHNHMPHILEDGSADYKNLDVFESVRENDAVAICTPPEAGTDGCTVTGKALPAQKGSPAKLPKGKNTRVSEDGLRLIATKSGRVDYIGGRVDVSDVLSVPGDVDMGIGNIDFTGDVIIKGNVISGLSVKATGNIEIQGIVESAVIVSDKNIVLKSGMQGMEKGVLQAEGNITARFIEKSRASAKGNIYADYIANSTINATGSVVMTGKHGKIFGSTIRAGKEVITHCVGTNTMIEIGVSPEMSARLAQLEHKCAETAGQIEKISNTLGAIPAGADISLEKSPLHQKLMQARNQLAVDYAQMTEEIKTLQNVLSQKSGGKIHVSSTIDQDVKLIIDSIPYVVKSSMDYVTFKYKDGNIIFSSCEKTSL